MPTKNVKMNNTAKQHFAVIIIAITALTIIELYALHQGVDGKLMAGVIFVIGGLAGFNFDKLKKFFIKVPSQ